MIKLGLTGSIGMGKSTTAEIFRGEGVPVIDADVIVHDLYKGEAVAPVAALFPSAITNGSVDRGRLSDILRHDPARFAELERIVHPLVRQKETEALAHYEESGEQCVVLDIPLLFENKAEGRVDKVVVVSCDASTQKERVLARPGMTEEKFAMILARQMPDPEKRRRADFVIDTGAGLEYARDQVRTILKSLSTGEPINA